MHRVAILGGTNTFPLVWPELLFHYLSIQPSLLTSHGASKPPPPHLPLISICVPNPSRRKPPNKSPAATPRASTPCTSSRSAYTSSSSSTGSSTTGVPPAPPPGANTSFSPSLLSSSSSTSNGSPGPSTPVVVGETGVYGNLARTWTRRG